MRILLLKETALGAEQYDEDTVIDWVCRLEVCAPLKPHIHSCGRVQTVRPGDLCVHLGGDTAVIVPDEAMRAMAWVD